MPEALHRSKVPYNHSTLPCKSTITHYQRIPIAKLVVPLNRHLKWFLRIIAIKLLHHIESALVPPALKNRWYSNYGQCASTTVIMDNASVPSRPQKPSVL